MTRDETKKLLAMVNAFYPNFKVADPTITVDAWFSVLEPFHPVHIEAALRSYVTTDTSGFAPSVGSLITLAKSFTEKADEASAVDEIRRAIKDSLYHAEERFNDLSPLAKKVVGSPSALKSWGMMPSDEFETVIASHLRKNIRAQKTRQEQLEALPARLQQMLTTTAMLIAKKEE